MTQVAMGEERRILHLDMDAFFAAIELQRHPELRGRPVIVGGAGDPSRRGVVSTATYEARACGVRSGMALRLARRLCPQAAFLPVDFELYRAFSGRIMAILHRFSATVEEGGLDEAFLDVPAADAAAVARRVKEAVFAETALTCSVGVGPNKLLAKMASDLEKPDGLTVLEAADVAKRLGPLPVRRLPWVGPKTEKRLAEMGVKTIAELATLPHEVLAARFGPAHGGWLFAAARGRDEAPLVTHWEPKSVSREETFERDTGDGAFLESELERLTDAVSARLQGEGCRGRTVTVKLRYRDFETETHAVTLKEATDDAVLLREASKTCFHRFPREKKVRLLGVRVSGLERERGDAPP